MPRRGGGGWFIGIHCWHVAQTAGSDLRGRRFCRGRAATHHTTLKQCRRGGRDSGFATGNRICPARPTLVFPTAEQCTQTAQTTTEVVPVCRRQRWRAGQCWQRSLEFVE